jgi:hypothetical protein
MANKQNKKPSTKTDKGPVWHDSHWSVRWGKLLSKPGRPHLVRPLLRWFGEKIPFDALSDTRKKLEAEGATKEGVYIAHDSMGYARYVGRGNVFQRLAARKKARPRELAYFSFYLVADKKHEREIETLLIRVGGAHLQFNERKKRVDISPGDVRDYEAGTNYVERQLKKGRKKKRGG